MRAEHETFGRCCSESCGTSGTTCTVNWTPTIRSSSRSSFRGSDVGWTLGLAAGLDPLARRGGRISCEDAKSEFRESTRLKGLMDDTGATVQGRIRRFAQRSSHHPPSQSSPRTPWRSLRVGAMLSNGEWKQAQALVQEPLHAVGCRFVRDDLSTRILAQTNYYPSLIQLYGAELVRRLRDSTKPFPYRIGDDDIDGAYAASTFAARFGSGSF